MRLTRAGLVASAFLLAQLAAAGEAGEPRYLIYLHGGIVQEQQDARPRHPEFGYYELEKILDTFRERGFVVSGTIRPKTASVSESADVVVAQVGEILDSGVSAERITVLGGSMGAGIALVASTRLQNPDLRFAVLGTCLSEDVRVLADAGKGVSGHVLAIREASDEFTGDCPAWDNDDERSLVAREIVLDTGLAHGFLYQPLPEWVDPVLAWVEPR